MCRLQVLGLINCPQLTNVASLGILRELQILAFGACKKVPEASWQELEKKLPDCVIIKIRY